MLQPWQAFAKLFGDNLKSRVDTEWQEYEENPNETYTTKNCFNFHNKKMQEWYEELDPDVRKQVEEFRVQCKEEGDDDENPNLILKITFPYIYQVNN